MFQWDWMFQNQLWPFCYFFDLKIKADPYLHATQPTVQMRPQYFSCVSVMTNDEPPTLPIAPLVKMQRKLKYLCSIRCGLCVASCGLRVNMNQTIWNLLLYTEQYTKFNNNNNLWTNKIASFSAGCDLRGSMNRP